MMEERHKDFGEPVITCTDERARLHQKEDIPSTDGEKKQTIRMCTEADKFVDGSKSESS